MYNNILNGLCKLYNVPNTYKSIASLLEDLQDASLELFQGYRNDNISINYFVIDIQAAYILRYYPQYSQIIRKILDGLKKSKHILPFNEKNLQACFFGGGPVPELYGWIGFLRTHYGIVSNVDSYVLDMYADSWAKSRKVVTDSIIPPILGDIKLNLNGINFDLTDSNAITGVKKYISNSNMVVFQNCFNEIPTSKYVIAKNNIVEICKSMKVGSILILIDLSSYKGITNLMLNIAGHIRSFGLGTILEISLDSSTTFDASLIYPVPQIILDNLMTGMAGENQNGLIPRKWVEFHHLVIKKM